MTITSVVTPQQSLDALSILTPRVDQFSDGAFASELATTTKALQTASSPREATSRATSRSVDASARAQRDAAADDRSAATAASAKADRADRADRANRAADDRAATAKADRDEAAAEDRAEVAKTKGERTNKPDRSAKSDRAAKTARTTSTKDADAAGDDAAAAAVNVETGVAAKPVVMNLDAEQEGAQGQNEGEAIDVAVAKATGATVASNDQTVAAAVASDLTAAATEVNATAADVNATVADVNATVADVNATAADVNATVADVKATAADTTATAPVHVKAEAAETSSQQSTPTPDTVAQQAFTVAQQGSSPANVAAKTAFEGAKPGATSMTVDASTSITATGQSAAPATAMSDTIKATATAAPTPVATQLAAHMSNFRGRADGSYETTLTLHPNDLGQVSIRIEVLNGTIALHAIGAHSAAVDALREAMPQLQQELADAGLNLIGSQVSQQSGQGQQSADRTPVQETAPQINSTLNSSSRSSEQDVSASTGLLGRDGRVDVRV
jgi:flagellar hook-length control protein FliK